MSGELVLEVDNSTTYIVSGRLDREQYKYFKQELGYREENFEHIKKRFKNEKPYMKDWDGYRTNVCYNKRTCRCHIKKDYTHFSTGLLRRARNFFTKYKIPFKLIDIRKPVQTGMISLSMSDEFDLRDYQKKIVDDACNAERGIIRVATGGGKCIGKDSVCLTENGMLTIEELAGSMAKDSYKYSDLYIYTPLVENNIDRTSHIYRNGISEVISIITKSGFKISGTPNHKIKVFINNELIWKRLDSISFYDKIAIVRGSNLFGKDDFLDKEEARSMGGMHFYSREVPKSIRSSIKKIVTSFIKGICDDRNSFLNHEESETIFLYSFQRNSASQLQSILLNFGIVAKLDIESSGNVLKIEGNDYHLFLKEFLNKESDIKLDNNFYYDEVHHINKSIDDTYDFVVPKSHSFVSNGMINHNTAIASAIIKEVGLVPFAFYVTSVDLMHQARKEFKKFILRNGLPLEVGAVGGGLKEIKDITVMTVQTAIRALDAKYKKYDDEESGKDNTDISDIKEELRDFIHSAKGMIADECHHWQAETCQIVSDCSQSARYKWGMSATPYRDKGDDILIEACFGRVIASISASFLIDRGYLVRPEIYFIDMKNSDYNKYNSYHNIYEDYVVNNSVRNSYISRLASRFYEEGKMPLVLVKNIAHGNILKELIPGSEFVHGGSPIKKRKEYIEKMKNGECGVTISSIIFDEGIDVRPLDTLILAGSGKSATRALQRIGRVIRPYSGPRGEKKFATVIDFADRAKYLDLHSMARKRIYSTEPRFKIEDLKV